MIHGNRLQIGDNRPRVPQAHGEQSERGRLPVVWVRGGHNPSRNQRACLHSGAPRAMRQGAEYWGVQRF